ncbi:hypothetical protein BGZ73_009073 [Actinomortierella ambigua]|nr:hypothetical protein BGZ73_009073 [Actinomortierella ambigua]
MGWTAAEELLCVLEDGTVRMYNLQGECTQFSLFAHTKESKDNRVIDVQIWRGGLVALTGDLQLIAVTDFEQHQPEYLIDPCINEPPHSWIVIPPEFTLSRHVEVLLACNDTILTVDKASARDECLDQGPFTKMAMSPDGSFLALFGKDGKLSVVSSDFSRSLSEFSTQTKEAPLQLVWCGTDSVVLYWDKFVVMVGPHGDWIPYTYDDSVYLIPEIDGVRIIGSKRCEFLQKVPSATEDIFKIGSTTPAAILYDTFENLDAKEPKVDGNLRNIRPELAEAVETCIEAAGHELDHDEQKRLLRTASFGKSYLDTHDADAFVNMCKALRVLNAVRSHEIGIPLTYTQYQATPPETLINRLIIRKQYLLAIRICDYLDLSTDRILIGWACSKIKNAVDDDDNICRAVVEKLASRPGLSYSKVAQEAYKSGRQRLAIKLLDYEPRAGDQVPLLLNMKQYEHALIKAIESGDTDLVYHVILRVRKDIESDSDFFKIISNKPLACRLFESYYKQNNPDLIRKFYYQDDRHVDNANLLLLESYRQKNINSKFASLRQALKLYQGEKEYSFEAKAIDESIKLFTAQQTLERELHQDFIGLSVSSTIYKLITLNEGNRASKIKSEFKVPDKRYWWIRLRAMVEIRDWDSVEQLAKSKKSPIGYEPFVEECMKAMQFREAAKYIPKCDTQVRAGLYLRIEHFQEAADHAFALKDIDMLREIRDKCPNMHLKTQVDNYLTQLVSGR